MSAPRPMVPLERFKIGPQSSDVRPVVSPAAAVFGHLALERVADGNGRGPFPGAPPGACEHPARPRQDPRNMPNPRAASEQCKP